MMEYQQDAQRTATSDYEKISSRIDSKIIDLLHGAIGISTEGGELLDALKKHVYYGKELDEVNIIEEVGDVLWYIALICNTLQISIEEVMRRNIDKLKTRYPEKFTEDHAINRDLDKEREILERR